jgi:hypothetical protein
MRFGEILLGLGLGGLLVALLLSFGMLGCAQRSESLTTAEQQYQQNLDEYNQLMQTSPRFRCLAEASRQCEEVHTYRDWSKCIGDARAKCPAQ